jgi:DNA-binding transcriptional LysR family regulator
MNLDVESLRTFLAVLDHGGMTSAANHLGMTQSAVSWKIKRLEQRVGRPLLIRDGHTLRPSSDGRALVDDARQIVEIHDRAAARLQSSDLIGTVRLGSNVDIEMARLSSLLGRFKRSHPGVTIEFAALPTSRLEEMLAAGELDVALLQVNSAGLRPDDVVLWSDQLVWATCCEALHDDEEVLPLINYGDDCFYRALSEPMLTDRGIDHVVAFSGQSNNSVRSALSAGLGVGVVGASMLGDDIVEWPRGPSLGPLPCVHQVVRSASGDHSRVVAALVDEVVAELSEPDAQWIG